VTLAPAERRGARLLFAAELASGRIGEAQLDTPAVRRAARPARRPHRPVRLGQRLLMRRDPSLARRLTRRAARARRSVLGADAAAPPRFLVRMDEYPHYETVDHPGRYGDTAFATWRDVMATAGCAHLVAVVPRPASAPLDPAGTVDRALLPEELARLAQLRADGTTLALHGYDHRTRDPSPRRHSELAGLGPADLATRLDRAEAAFVAAVGERPRIFVPPFNRFDPEHYGELASRYAVVCGGPENVLAHGLRRTPAWRGEAVWLPAYPPLYGTAAEVLPAVERELDDPSGLWIPVVLHWGWEAERGWEDLRRLADRLAPHAAPWETFLDAVEASR